MVQSPYPLPEPPLVPEVPRTPFETRRFQAGGREIRPFKGTGFPVPGDPEEEFQLAFQAWKIERANGVGSVLEYIVYNFLVFTKHQIDGIDFEYQSSSGGGRTEFGGFVIDFLLPSRGLALQPEGARWHLLEPTDRARLLIEQAILAGRGIRAIYLWEQQLLTSPDYVLEAAWRGNQLQTGLMGFL